MVGKITKHDPENQYEDHVYPPSFVAGRSKPEFDPQDGMEVGIEREVTVTRDSVSFVLLIPSVGGLMKTEIRSVTVWQFEQHYDYNSYKKSNLV